MKVCTDSCLFGALVEVSNAGTILDIGAGTGLLSLMLSQKTQSTIIALEPDEDACSQAAENVSISPFHNIIVLPFTIQKYAMVADARFDLIVCNPPFYKNYLKSSNTQYNSSIHSSALPFDELVATTKKLLSEDGAFWLLLPNFEFNSFIRLADEYKLHLNRRFTVFHNSNSEPIRTIGVFSNNESSVINKNIYIKTVDNVYTEEFKSLLQDYYNIF